MSKASENYTNRYRALTRTMKTHEIYSDGKKHLFNVVKNTTEPCPHCGVPACGKEDIIWYEFDNKKPAIIFDGGYFDLAGEEYFKNNKQTYNFESLPNFMKDWYQLEGWTDCWDYNGYILDIDDFIKSMELLKNNEMGKWISVEEIVDLQNLAKEAKSKNVELKIVRG